MENFSKYVKKWVELDNKIYKINSTVKEIKKERDVLGKSLSNYMLQNNMSKTLINISDGKIKCSESKIQNPLTYCFLSECFQTYFNNQEEATKLINFIKSKRSYKSSYSLKRFYSKKKNI